MDLTRLAPGLRGSATLAVAPQHSARAVGSGTLEVLGTPVLIGILEAAAVACVEALLPEGASSVGTHLDVRHTAPTPIGLRVTAEAELLAVDKRLLRFRLTAHDGRETIADGTHERAIVDVARFQARVAGKAEPGTAPPAGTEPELTQV